MYVHIHTYIHTDRQTDSLLQVIMFDVVDEDDDDAADDADKAYTYIIYRYNI